MVEEQDIEVENSGIQSLIIWDITRFWIKWLLPGKLRRDDTLIEPGLEFGVGYVFAPVSRNKLMGIELWWIHDL
jgi:hypothetical protein